MGFENLWKVLKLVVKEKWPGDPVVHGCQWVMSFESDADWCWLPGSELQHPELNYGPGISGELRVTHDSHQEPHPGGSGRWSYFFFLGGEVPHQSVVKYCVAVTVPFDEKNPISESPFF